MLHRVSMGHSPSMRIVAKGRSCYLLWIRNLVVQITEQKESCLDCYGLWQISRSSVGLQFAWNRIAVGTGYTFLRSDDARSVKLAPYVLSSLGYSEEA
jgi:hypothetical protein